MNKKQYKEFGKQGAEKRWSPKRLKKQDLLEGLRKHIDGSLYPHIIKWSVEKLQTLFDYYENK